MSVVDEIFALYARRGGATYGEGVTQSEHALQAAWLAEREGASPELIAAALLHDIGHLLHDFAEDIADQGVDTQHESLASAWLSQHFGPAVTEPVRLHVAAKRYLCAVEPGYFDALSQASKLSLKLQGGPMSSYEVGTFRSEPHWQEAVRLRRWDEAAKQPRMRVATFQHFEMYVRAGRK